jgi:hypothetical protein
MRQTLLGDPGPSLIDTGRDWFANQLRVFGKTGTEPPSITDPVPDFAQTLWIKGNNVRKSAA